MAGATRPSSSDIAGAARETFGWEDLRPEQLDAVRSVLDGRDLLVVMPTGSGKSAIYKLAGLFLSGVTVVVYVDAGGLLEKR